MHCLNELPLRVALHALAHTPPTDSSALRRACHRCFSFPLQVALHGTPLAHTPDPPPTHLLCAAESVSQMLRRVSDEYAASDRRRGIGTDPRARGVRTQLTSPALLRTPSPMPMSLPEPGAVTEPVRIMPVVSSVALPPFKLKQLAEKPVDRPLAGLARERLVPAQSTIVGTRALTRQVDSLVQTRLKALADRLGLTPKDYRVCVALVLCSVACVCVLVVPRRQARAHPHRLPRISCCSLFRVRRQARAHFSRLPRMCRVVLWVCRCQ